MKDKIDHETEALADDITNHFIDVDGFPDKDHMKPVGRYSQDIP